MHTSRLVVGAAFLGALILLPFAAATVEWVEANSHRDILNEHIHAYVGAYLSDAGGQCKFSQYAHNDGDTDTSPPYGSDFTYDHSADNTYAWSKTELTEDGIPTGLYTYADIWTNPTPPCAF